MQHNLAPQYTIRRRSPKPWRRLLGAGLGLIALAVLVYHIPAVNSRLAWRVDNLRTRLVYFFNPPDEAIFLPEENLAAISSATAAALIPQATGTPMAATPTNQSTQVPLPAAVNLEGVVYVDQHGGWNLCGPANLTMALKFWGWEGTRNDVTAYVKPGIDDPGLDAVTRGKPDKNVMPYELEDFVDTQAPGMQAVLRVGGEIETVKRLIAAGFPVLVEKGYSERDASGQITWLGHYLFVTGYDDAGGYFIVQDAYLRTNTEGTGANLHSSYEEFISQWRSFNYLFLVVYPEERLDDVVIALGPWADDEWANQNAYEIAQAEVETLTGLDLFFAWFNLGSSHVRLLQYVDAAFAYDQAFQLYAELPNDSTKRPYRIMWYQTGPYWAYYYSGRYQDVINLANNTLYNTIDEPTLEESLYWRGLAYEALGQIDNAIADYRETVRLNRNFAPGWAQLQRLGVSG